MSGFIYCTSCGAEIKNNAKFCIKCGFNFGNKTENSSLIAEQNRSDISNTNEKIVDSANVKKEEVKKDGGGDIAIGLLFLIGGIIVTVVSYSSASESGGRYVVTYGAIIYGIFKIFSGIAKS